MKRLVKLIGLVIFLAVMLVGTVVLAAGTSTVSTPGKPMDKPKPATTQQPPQRCCIAGEYKGHHKDDPSKTCPKPGEGDFKMVINQDQACGSKIWGKIINPDGTTQDFTGTVNAGKEGCCNIQGIMRRPGRPAATGAPAEPPEETTFKGVLCKKGGKWTGGGSYTTKRGTIICNGKWNITQM